MKCRSWKKSELGKARQREICREWKRKRFKKGFCGGCFKRKRAPHSVRYCEGCLEYNAARCRLARLKQRVA